MLKRHWLIAGLVVVAIAVFAAFQFKGADKDQYFTVKVDRGDIRQVVEATGTINAVTTVQVGSHVTPEEVIRVWKTRFGDFWPKGQKMFLAATGIAPGEVGLINASLPGAPTMATGVLVIYADDESFSFMSPEGHPFAGPLTFSAFSEDGGTTVAPWAWYQTGLPLGSVTGCGSPNPRTPRIAPK